MRRVKIGSVVLLLLCVFARHPVATAMDWGPVTIHGFLGQGYLQSTDNNWMGVKMSEGSFEFNEAGLNFTSMVSENLRVGMQLFARDLGNRGNHQVELDWAVGDYHWRDYLSIRMGKVKLPHGWWNHLRDVDLARVPVLLPLGLYPDTLRDLNNAFMGAQLYGTLPAGGMGDLEYELYGGGMDLDDKPIIREFMQTGAEEGIGGDNSPVPLDDLQIAIADIKARVKYMAGVSLRWNTPLDGLRLGWSMMHAPADTTNTTVVSGTMAGFLPMTIRIPTETDLSMKYIYAASLDYLWENLRFTFEYSQLELTFKTSMRGIPVVGDMNLPRSTQIIQGYYAQVAYRVNEWLQLSTYYSEMFPDMSDKAGDRYVARGQPDHRAWLKDFTLTARFDLTAWWLLKLEAHMINGTGYLRLADNPDGLTQSWQLFAVKTTFSF